MSGNQNIAMEISDCQVTSPENLCSNYITDVSFPSHITEGIAKSYIFTNCFQEPHSFLKTTAIWNLTSSQLRCFSHRRETPLDPWILWSDWVISSLVKPTCFKLNCDVCQQKIKLCLSKPCFVYSQNPMGWYQNRVRVQPKTGTSLLAFCSFWVPKESQRYVRYSQTYLVQNHQKHQKIISNHLLSPIKDETTTILLAVQNHITDATATPGSVALAASMVISASPAWSWWLQQSTSPTAWCLSLPLLKNIYKY